MKKIPFVILSILTLSSQAFSVEEIKHPNCYLRFFDPGLKDILRSTLIEKGYSIVLDAVGKKDLQNSDNDVFYLTQDDDSLIMSKVQKYPSGSIDKILFEKYVSKIKYENYEEELLTTTKEFPNCVVSDTSSLAFSSEIKPVNCHLRFFKSTNPFLKDVLNSALTEKGYVIEKEEVATEKDLQNENDIFYLSNEGYTIIMSKLKKYPSNSTGKILIEKYTSKFKEFNNMEDQNEDFLRAAKELPNCN